MELFQPQGVLWISLTDSAYCSIELKSYLINLGSTSSTDDWALIRAARGLLGWSGKALAQHAHIGTATLQRIEHSSSSISSQYRTIRKIEQAFTEAGVHFIQGQNGEAGVELIPNAHPKAASHD